MKTRVENGVKRLVDRMEELANGQIARRLLRRYRIIDG